MVRTGTPGFTAVTAGLLDNSFYERPAGGQTGIIQRQTNLQVLQGLLRLAFDQNASGEVRALALDAVKGLDAWLKKQSPRDATWRAHYTFALYEIEKVLHNPALLESTAPVTVPPGSPIGQ